MADKRLILVPEAFCRIKLGYTGVLDRFTKDVAFALRSTERGLTRSAMLVQDALATAVLPNPGRNTEQRTMGVGPQGSMTYGAGSTAALTARLLGGDRPALLKAGLISSMTEVPIAISWLGAVYSVMEFAGIIAMTNHVSRLVTFGISTVTESPPFERTRESAIQYLRHIVDAEVEAAERSARKQEDDARRSQQAQPRVQRAIPGQRRGKSGGSSKGSSTRPAQAEAARSSYSSYGSYGHSQGYDLDWRGRWYWDYSRNCWAEY